MSLMTQQEGLSCPSPLTSMSVSTFLSQSYLDLVFYLFNK